MITVGEVMSTELHTLPDTESVLQARRLMGERHVRHMPVVDPAGIFVGLLTQRDVLATTVSVLADVDHQSIEELESSIPVREVMTTNMAVVSPDTDLKEAATYLLEHKLGCLPVMSEEELVGILTEADFIKLVLSLLDRLD